MKRERIRPGLKRAGSVLARMETRTIRIGPMTLLEVYFANGTHSWIVPSQRGGFDIFRPKGNGVCRRWRRGWESAYKVAQIPPPVPLWDRDTIMRAGDSSDGGCEFVCYGRPSVWDTITRKKGRQVFVFRRRVWPTCKAKVEFIWRRLQRSELRLCKHHAMFMCGGNLDELRRVTL